MGNEEEAPDDAAVLVALEHRLENLSHRAELRQDFYAQMEKERQRWQQLFHRQLDIDLNEERRWANQLAKERDRDEMAYIYSQIQSGAGDASLFKKLSSKSVETAQREREEHVSMRRCSLAALKTHAVALSERRQEMASAKTQKRECEVQKIEDRRCAMHALYQQNRIASLVKEERSRRAKIVRQELNRDSELWLEMKRGEMAEREATDAAQERARAEQRLHQIELFQIEALNRGTQLLSLRNQRQRDELIRAREHHLKRAEECDQLVNAPER